MIAEYRNLDYDKNDERKLSIFERKILRRMYGPICERRQWRKRYNRELEHPYNEPNTARVIKSARLRLAGHVVPMDDNDLPKKNIVGKPWRSMRTWPTEIKMD